MNIIVSQDEVHFQLGTNVTGMWFPKGCTPIVGSAPGRDSVPYSGFVFLGKDNGHLFVTKPDRFTFETTIHSIREFLATYPTPDGCRLYMILDNAPWHKKVKRLIRDEANTEYQDIRKKVEFLDIPPYSPDLNPIEQVWRITRREVTHNRYFPDLNTLETTLDAYFKQYEHHTEKLANLCTFNFEKKNHTPKKRIVVGDYYARKRSTDAVVALIVIPETPVLSLQSDEQKTGLKQSS